MEKRQNKLTSIAVGLAIVIGVAINEVLAKQTNFPNYLNWIITVVVSASLHEFLYYSFVFAINHSDLLLKLFWGKLYIKGFWTYTYINNGEKKYGAWCIEQTLDSVTIKGFGLTPDGQKNIYVNA